MPLPFADRAAAGKALADRLIGYRGDPTLLVLGLPRGGVPVAAEVARALHAPLDVLIVRKLGVPGHEELAMGAVASGGARVLNMQTVHDLGISSSAIAAVEARERQEISRREAQYRGNAPPLDVRGRTVILVDDGLATGSTMRAAALALRAQKPRRIIGAAPVAAADVCRAMREVVDDMVCLETPADFFAVGRWYDDFRQTSDEDVRAALLAVNGPQHAPAARAEG